MSGPIGNGSLTRAGRIEANKPERSDPWLLCLTIEHEYLTPPIRVVQNTESITRSGHTFHAAPFEIDLPSSDPDSTPRVPISVPNFVLEGDPQQRTVGDIVESLPTPARVTLECVFASRPDIAEFGPLSGELRETTLERLYVRGVVVFDEGLSEEPYPGDSFDPAGYPGLHLR